jgi:tetratricopeptide (TPR) repeat protein
MNRILIIAAFVFSSHALFAGGIDTLFYKANAAYDHAFYEEAVVSYEKIIEQGFESSQLYFNLGNSYFKLKDYPSAIYYYEKAKKLSPNDEDILFNLTVANGLIVDKIEPVPDLIFTKWWRSFYTMFDTNTWAWISVAGFMLFFILFGFYLFSRMMTIRKTAFFSGMFVLLITIFTFAVAYQKYSTVNNQSAAIVFIPTITVKSSPNPNSVDLFVIHEGSKVELRDKVGEWYEIKIASGGIGWLPAEALRKI